MRKVIRWRRKTPCGTCMPQPCLPQPCMPQPCLPQPCKPQPCMPMACNVGETYTYIVKQDCGFNQCPQAIKPCQVPCKKKRSCHDNPPCHVSRPSCYEIVMKDNDCQCRPNARNECCQSVCSKNDTCDCATMRCDPTSSFNWNGSPQVMKVAVETESSCCMEQKPQCYIKCYKPDPCCYDPKPSSCVPVAPCYEFDPCATYITCLSTPKPKPKTVCGTCGARYPTPRKKCRKRIRRRRTNILCVGETLIEKLEEDCYCKKNCDVPSTESAKVAVCCDDVNEPTDGEGCQRRSLEYKQNVAQHVAQHAAQIAAAAADESLNKNPT